MAEPCGFPGNPDLYGLGIRTGIYLQWISALTSSYFHLEDTPLLLFNYFAFSLAIMAALFVLTFHGQANTHTHTIEIIIMIYLFFGGLYSISPRSSQGRQPPRVIISRRLILGPATGFTMLIYSSWFWINGRNGSRFVETPCGNTIFLFARVPARYFGRVAIFFAVLSIALAVVVFFATLRYYCYYPRMSMMIARLPWRSLKGLDISLAEGHQGTGTETPLVRSLNEDPIALAQLQRLLQSRCGLLPPSRAKSARVVSVTKTYIAFKVLGDCAATYTINFEPPLRTYEDLPDRVSEMCQRELELEADPDESISGRLTASGRHFRQGIMAWVGLFNRKSRAKTSAWPARIYLLEIIISPISCVYSILAVELMIRWNLVAGVYEVGSTGQLIPLIVAAVGLVDMVLNVRKKYKERRLRNKWKSGIGTAVDRANGNGLEPGRYSGRYCLQGQDGRWV